MLQLTQQTEQQLQEIALQTQQTVQQLIDSFILNYRQEQLVIKKADESYADYLNNGVSFSLMDIKKANGLDS